MSTTKVFVQRNIVQTGWVIEVAHGGRFYNELVKDKDWFDRRNIDDRLESAMYSIIRRIDDDWRNDIKAKHYEEKLSKILQEELDM